MSSVSALGSSVLIPRRLSADPMGILRTMKDIGRLTCSIVCHLRISPPLAPYAKSNSSACRSLNSFGVGVCFQGVCCEPPSCNRSLKGNIERVCGALPLLLASSAGSIREEVKVERSHDASVVCSKLCVQAATPCWLRCGNEAGAAQSLIII